MSSVIPVRLSPVDDTECLCSVYHAWRLSLSSCRQHLQSSALALWYSLAQYCFPVWTYLSYNQSCWHSAQLRHVPYHCDLALCTTVLSSSSGKHRISSTQMRSCSGQADWEDSPTWRMAAPSCCYLPSWRTLRLDADLLDIMRQWQDDWKWMMPQSTNQDFISHDVMEPRWTAYGLTNVTAHPLAKCGVLEQLTVSMWQKTKDV